MNSHFEDALRDIISRVATLELLIQTRHAGGQDAGDAKAEAESLSKSFEAMCADAHD